MSETLTLLAVVLLIPVIGGSVFSVATLGTALRYWSRARSTVGNGGTDDLPAVSLLKPCYGVDKDLEANLRSACEQAYPGPLQVVMSVQRRDDPALPILRRLAAEYGDARVTVVAAEAAPAINGKIQNLTGALAAARHNLVMISDSDVCLPPDTVRAIAAPFADPGIGSVCTFYRAVRAERWYERLELLTLNADFTPSVIFAEVTGAADFCLGSSVAVRREALARIGGFESLSEFLVEDYELGRKLRQAGYRTVVVPHVVDVVVDLRSPKQGWDHLVYWDQNTKVIRPVGFFLTLLTRAIPFALLFALVRGFDATGMLVLGVAVAIRIGCAGGLARVGLGDAETVRNLPLLPLRDLVGLASWMAAFSRRTVVWRGRVFDLGRDGRMVPRSEVS